MTFSDGSYPVLSDIGCLSGFWLIGTSFLAAASACLLFATRASDRGFDGKGLGAKIWLFALWFTALLLILLALAVFVRIGTPTALHLGRINGAWCLSLQRRALSPVVRRLDDLGL